MGHERTGALPHSKRWRDVVAQMASSSGTADEVAGLANSTLENVQKQFRNLYKDEGVVAAFQFLIMLAKSASSSEFSKESHIPSIDLDQNPSTLRLVAELRSWVDDQESSKEYADIAKKASADTIVLWHEQQMQQPSLFPVDGDSRDVWRRMDNGASFCEVARLFFSKFTERYLNYFLEREASAVSTNIHLRDEIDVRLREHVDGVSKYAFETARITQSFAAGWFNNHARQGVPSKEESQRFLSIAFGKMQEELLREASSNG